MSWSRGLKTKTKQPSLLGSYKQYLLALVVQAHADNDKEIKRKAENIVNESIIIAFPVSSFLGSFGSAAV